jgi:hypothetical protein
LPVFLNNFYEALDIPVEIRKLEEPVKTTLATVNVAVGITPELQESKASFKREFSEINSELSPLACSKISIFCLSCPF